MKFKPNPLLYSANQDFFSTFKLVITLRSSVHHPTLVKAVSQAMLRYPFFSVCTEKDGNDLQLTYNPLPVPVFDDERCVVLGTEQSNKHLLAFGCKGKQIFLHVSHFLADGMGIAPLLQTVLFLYLSALYGTNGLHPERILMPHDPVHPDEYAYPFPVTPPKTDAWWNPRALPTEAYSLNPHAFDNGGLYAYHLHVPQKALMAKASPSDGSPVSFLSVMLYRALCALDPAMQLPVVAHVQHQYRSALKTPLNRHSLVSYLPVRIAARAKDWSLELQNTLVRGQIVLGSDPTAEWAAINRLIGVFAQHSDANLEQKKQAMRQFVENSICAKTFGISYVGKMDWCGMDAYVEDMHAYIGEKHTSDMLLMEIITIGENFSINVMQSGQGKLYVDALLAQLHALDIPADLVGEERYTLCDTQIPE